MRLTSMFGMQISFADHQAREYNITCNAMSRGTPPQQLGLTEEEIAPSSSLPWLDKFFSLCDPTSEILSVENYSGSTCLSFVIGVDNLICICQIALSIMIYSICDISLIILCVYL